MSDDRERRFSVDTDYSHSETPHLGPGPNMCAQVKAKNMSEAVKKAVKVTQPHVNESGSKVAIKVTDLSHRVSSRYKYGSAVVRPESREDGRCRG